MPSKLRQTKFFSRICRVFAATGVVFVASLAIAAVADAQLVNNAGPHVTYSWGDCTVNLGNMKTATGAARGAVDVVCGHYHTYINAKVDLLRWNGSQWIDMTTSGWRTLDNAYALSTATNQQVCGGGTAYWNDIATVNVGGAQHTFNLASNLGYYPKYAPPAC
jgi:hypothetical protein